MSDLESRYRRLLRLYPRAHRAVHEEEMLGVLMAGARPGIAESADLVWGAIRIRFRHAFGPESAAAWRRAPGSAGLITMMVLAAEVLSRSMGQLGDLRWLLALPGGAVLVVALIRWGPRWLAAAATWTWVVLNWQTGYLYLDLPGGSSIFDFRAMFSLLLMVPFVLAGVLVTLRAERPALPGRAVFGWLVLLTVGWLPATFRYELGLTYEQDLVTILVPVVVLAVLAGRAARTPQGRRGIVLAAVPVGIFAGSPLLLALLGETWPIVVVGLLVAVMSALAGGLAGSGRRVSGSRPRP
ncbi:hypothetical protein [Herbidospora sp. RD11066]